MPAEDSRLAYLFECYINKRCSDAERKEFFEMVAHDQNAESLQNLINIVNEQYLTDVSEERATIIYDKIWAEIGRKPGKRVVFPSWVRMAVAASIILIAGIVAMTFIIKKPVSKPSIAVQHEIDAPKNTRAVITLADGSKVYLDSAGSGQLAVQGNIKLVKLSDGQIVYQSSNGEIIKELKYNTLSNPRGSKVIDMKLSDGSHVWLNSGSSITYPVAFVGNDRKVTIEGEAYFEVAHDATKPFIVSKGETSVQVLGTHFNVNAYSDEEEIKVTLLEGSVKVSNKLNQVKIRPGEQARVGSDINVIKDLDVDAVVAWQRGMFEFNNTELTTILRQVSRWYDVDIVYEKQPKLGPLGGGISRNLPLSEVLKLLEANGAKFNLDGKTLKVL